MNHAVNWEAISALGQLVGALAVVISLIYLANEVRSNTRATREASMRWVQDNYTQWVRQVSGHPDLSELYYRGIHDFESLEGVELVRFSGLMVELFRRSEEMYYLRLQGHLEPYVWNGLEASMRDFNRYPGVQAWWRFRSSWFSEASANHLNQLQQPALPPRRSREPKAGQCSNPTGEANDPRSKQVQRACHDPLSWLISFSLDSCASFLQCPPQL